MAEKCIDVVSETFPTHRSVLILDFEELDKEEQVQSEMATLRHEAGHLLYLENFQLDKQGKPLKSNELKDPLKSQFNEYSFGEDLSTGGNVPTESHLMSEYAAETLEVTLPGKPGKFEPFDPEKFKEENDPQFGIGGYHDLDGNEQTPTGFGVRVATGLTLIAAKQMARDLKEAVKVPVLLLTVPKPKTEQRLFDVLMLEGADKKNVGVQFDQLKSEVPELSKYKGRIVAY